MKNLSLTFCLTIAVLLASVGGGFASNLPACPSSGYFHNCFGTWTWKMGAKYVGEWKKGNPYGQGTITWSKGTINGNKYVGEFKGGRRTGQGIYYYRSGKIEEGIWENGNFQYAQKTPYSRKPSVLRTAFRKLSKQNRRQLQSNLKDLGFYKSSIDGLYGKGTAGALTTYNKQNLNGSDLKKSENLNRLIDKTSWNNLKLVK